MLIDRFEKQGLIQPPKWLSNNLIYLGYGGSVSYGANADTSDMDCFGFCIPPKPLLFPYSIGGEILGFGKQHQRFNVWQQHHVKTSDNKKEYDFSIYNIVDFFNLAMENNPNILDILFLPRRCILHTSQIGELIRENRKSFLHKGAMHKFRGYMFAQMSKIKNKTNSNNPKRKELIEQFGFDTKFAMNVVRLALEVEQILVEHDLDIERNSEILKSIRRGEWTLDQLDSWAIEKEKNLETLYANSTLRNVPNEKEIKELLLTCLEMHYGNLSNTVARNPSIDSLLDDLRNIVDRYHVPNETKKPW